MNDYQKMMENAGGVDLCYGQIGWSGHLAFWDPEMGFPYEFNFHHQDEWGRLIFSLRR